LTNFQTVWNIDNNLDGIPDIIQDTVLSTSMPFLGQPVVVTGTIEAEQFDRGGSNVAYLNVAANPTNSYRTTGMYITTNNMPFGYCLDQTRSNEWANYTINVLVPQTYAIETRVQGLGSNSVFELSFAQNGITYTNTGPLTNTTTAWAIVTGYAGLKAGTNVMTLKFLNAGMTNNSPATYVGRFDYITIYPWWQAGFTSTYTSTVSNLIVNSNSWYAATNNTYWIQQALSDVVASGGGTVLITNVGTNYVTQYYPNETNNAWTNSVLNIASSNVVISGTGTNVVLMGYNRATTIIYLGQDSAGHPAQCTNFTLENITLQGQPHLAVTNVTNTVYQSGQFLPQPTYDTGALTLFGGSTPSTYAYNLLFSNCAFVNADREIDLAGWSSNVLVQECSFIQFQGTNGSYTPGVYNTNIPYSSPDTNFLLGIFAQEPSYNIGVVGCSYNGNPNYTNQITSNPNPTNYITNICGAGNGLVYDQGGGNFFVLRNFITNNAIEAVQFNAGPGTVTGNTFWSWGNHDACGAFAANLYLSGATGTSYPNYSATFIGNSVTGNSYGAYNDFSFAQGPYTLNMSGNSLSLFLPVTNPTTENLPFGSAVEVFGCQNLNVCGNTMTSGGTAVFYYYAASCSNSVILANNFSGASFGGIEDFGTGPEIDQQVIGNVLGRGYGYHLKTLSWEGPNWFLYNNQYVNTNAVTVPIFTDSADLWAHITQ
jgi:hypothetical protein